MTTSSCTPGGATSEGVSCTYVGARSQDNLAPFFVQHRSLNLVPPSVQDTLHPRWFNNEYPYLLTQPVMHCVQDGRSTYRNSSTTTVDLPDHQRNHQTARGEMRTRMFERFTDRARRATVLAQEEARTLKHNYVGTEHILLGLIHEGEGVAFKALEELGFNLEEVRQSVRTIIGMGQQQPAGHIPFTPRAKRVQELSLRESLQLGHNYIGTEHLLLGLIREGEGVGAQVLTERGIKLATARQKVIQLLSGYTKADAQKALWLTKVQTAAAFYVPCSYCGKNITSRHHYTQQAEAVDAARQEGARLVGETVACADCQKRPLSDFGEAS